MSSLNKFQQNIHLVIPVSLIFCLFNLLILISQRGESRTPKATKMEIFVSIINEFQLLTVSQRTSSSTLAGVLDPRNRF